MNQRTFEERQDFKETIEWCADNIDTCRLARYADIVVSTPPAPAVDAEALGDRIALLDAWELLTRALGSPLPPKLYEAWGIVTVALQQMSPFAEHPEGRGERAAAMNELIAAATDVSAEYFECGTLKGFDAHHKVQWRMREAISAAAVVAPPRTGDDAEIEALITAAQAVADSFHATHADRSGLVHWEVSATAMKSLHIALHNVARLRDSRGGR